MSSWDIPWCLGGDFNVIRFPSERSTGGHLTWAMRDFSTFIDSGNLIDPPLEGARFTWSSHEADPVLSRIDQFLYSVKWEDHFQGVHQVILPKITSDHFSILLRVGEVYSGRRLLKFENMWLEVDGFCDLVNSFWNDVNVTGPSSFILAKKLSALKAKLKELNRDVFGHLEFKMAKLVEKVKSLDEKEQQQSLSWEDRVVRLEVK